MTTPELRDKLDTTSMVEATEVAHDNAVVNGPDGRRRRQRRGDRPGQGRPGRLGAAPGPVVDALAGQAGVCAEEERASPTARNSCDRRQGTTGPDRQRTGARVGSTVRAEILRIPAGPRLPRRNQGHPPGGEGRKRQTP